MEPIIIGCFDPFSFIPKGDLFFFVCGKGGSNHGTYPIIGDPSTFRFVPYEKATNRLYVLVGQPWDGIERIRNKGRGQSVGLLLVFFQTIVVHVVVVVVVIVRGFGYCCRGGGGGGVDRR